ERTLILLRLYWRALWGSARSDRRSPHTPPPPPAWLFPTRDGAGPLGPTSLQRTFAAVVRGSGLANHASIHPLARPYATPLPGPPPRPRHRRALADLAACRTAALGGHVTQCDHCAIEHYVYHSCRNRSCPTCHGAATAAWLAARATELLPVPYFHVVFTLPSE